MFPGQRASLSRQVNGKIINVFSLRTSKGGLLLVSAYTYKQKTNQVIKNKWKLKALVKLHDDTTLRGKNHHDNEIGMMSVALIDNEIELKQQKKLKTTFGCKFFLFLTVNR